MPTNFFNNNAPLNEDIAFNHGIECLEYGASSPDYRGRFYVKRVHGGFIFNCFNCGHKGFKPNNSKCAPSEIVEKFETFFKSTPSNTVYSYKKISLPHDMVSALENPDALMWLKSYDITDDEIRKYNLGYSKNMNRCILPVYVGNKLTAMQGRLLGKADKSKPKYLTYTTTKNSFFITNVKSPHLVIVEDILSAIKVGRQVCALSLLGSNTTNLLQKYVAKKEKVSIWLDFDKKYAASKYMFRLSQFYPNKVNTIITYKDPKEYRDFSITRYLGEESDV